MTMTRTIAKHVTEATPVCHDGLQTSKLAMKRELGQIIKHTKGLFKKKLFLWPFMQKFAS